MNKIDYTKLHWYSDNELYSLYSIVDFPEIMVHILDEKIIRTELHDEYK